MTIGLPVFFIFAFGGGLIVPSRPGRPSFSPRAVPKLQPGAHSCVKGRGRRSREYKMTKKRRHLSAADRASRPALEDRVLQVLKELEERANNLSPGLERDKLMRRVRVMNTSNHLNDWLASPGLRTPT